MDSVIVSGKYLYHLARFLASAVGRNSEWKLCYRASIDGPYDYTFHIKCDGKNNTVTVVKKNDYVFGGFTDVPWGIVIKLLRLNVTFLFNCFVDSTRVLVKDGFFTYDQSPTTAKFACLYFFDNDLKTLKLVVDKSICV